MNIYWITKVNGHMLHKTSRLECSESLRKRGHNVILVSGTEDKKVLKKNDHDGFLFLPIMKSNILSRISFNLSLLINLPRIVKKEKPDVLLIDAGNVYLPFLIPLRIKDCTLILDIRTLPLGDKKSVHSLLFDLSLILSKYVTHGLTTITPELSDILIKKYKLKKSKIGIWSSGVSLELFNPHRTDSNEEIENIFHDSTTFYLLYHGAYSPTRGIEKVIESLKEIEKPILKKIKLIIIGFNKQKRYELFGICKKLQIEDNVLFLPPVDYQHIPMYIQKIDVGIIPLPPQNKWWQVSAPLKTLEYLAMAKPIIATNIPFHKKIFEKGSCGILLKSTKRKDFATSIVSLYKNREKLKGMGNTGRKIVEQYYSWDKSGFDLEKSLHMILKKYEN